MQNIPETKTEAVLDLDLGGDRAGTHLYKNSLSHRLRICAFLLR